MILDNADVTFIGHDKRDRLRAVLSQFVEGRHDCQTEEKCKEFEAHLDFCVDQVWSLLERDWYNDECPLPMKLNNEDIAQINLD